MFRKITWFKRFLAKNFGLCVLMRPDEESAEWKNAQKENRTDFFMIFHFCPYCRRYYYSIAYDIVSKSSRFECGGCKYVFATAKFIGLCFTEIAWHLERCSVADKLPKKERRKERWRRWRDPSYGLPEERGGETAGESEIKAMAFLIYPIEVFLNMRIK